MPVLLHKPAAPASPELKTGHVYRLLQPTQLDRMYFTYSGKERRIIYLDSGTYEGGWNPSTIITLSDEPYVEVTLQEVQ